MHIEKKSTFDDLWVTKQATGHNFFGYGDNGWKMKTCPSKSADENRADKSVSVVHRVGGVYILVSDREL